MWLPKNQLERKNGVNGIVAVAIDKDKGSQNALKWAIDNILLKGTIVVLIHVKVKSSYSAPSIATARSGFDENLLVCKEPDASTRDIFLPFRVFCTRKDIQCKDIILEDVDVARALIEYASQTAIEHLVLGSTTKTGLLRFKVVDIPGTVSKGAPDFCTVYVIAKGKIQSMRSASRPAPSIATMRSPLNQPSSRADLLQFSDPNISTSNSVRGVERRSIDGRSFEATPPKSNEETDFFRSPFTRKGYAGKPQGELSAPDTDISFVSSGRPSTDRMFPSLYDDAGMSNSNPRLSYSSDTGMSHSNPRLSYSSDVDNNSSFESMQYGRRSLDMASASPPEFPSILQDSFERNSYSSSSQTMDEVEAEMRRLKLELKQTMEMYSTACKEALTAKQKAVELQRWKFEEERRLEEAKLKQEAALAIAEKEKAKSKAAMETAEAQKRIAELEAQKRVNAEMKALRESEERKKAIDALVSGDVRYRRYSIEEIEAATEFFKDCLKIGEGGYGPVFKCLLDHTPVAVKVLRPDAAQGRAQFQREVEVLSCIRHPNMVLLLGACPEYGCLVYEFMANGSLEDCLFRKGNKPSLSWQLRFKIAAEIGTGLLFLHQTKPEPLVHRDLKPGNILLDRNFVAKISDVGLARLVPPSVADTVTQYRMTSTAGTFCYIDPEYQQTGMLGVKSDVYSLGIIFLQILTGRPPVGLTHRVERAIEKGVFTEMLDQTVPDWPVEDALILAKMALKCAELRRRDRPDLGKEVLPELNRLRTMAEDSQSYGMFSDGHRSAPSQSQVSLQLDDIPHSGESTGVTSSPV